MLGVGSEEAFCVGVGGQEDRQNEVPGAANGRFGGKGEEYNDQRVGNVEC